MINQIIQKFNNLDVNNCHIEFTQSFYLNDSENGKCLAILTDEEATCMIENSDTFKIDFVAIDDCLIKDVSTEKCDALVSKKKNIWFIELKEVSREGGRTKYNQRKRRYREKATSQIAATINYFKNKGIDFKGFTVGGLICFPPFPSLSIPTSIPTTSSQNRILQFQNACGYTSIYEGNHIVL